jgi:Beta-lactamase class C and other penicillin binding proteins
MHIMDPMGLSDTWTWQEYDTAFVFFGGRRVPSVPGGPLWGGGFCLFSSGPARFGLLFLRAGHWASEALFPPGWVDALRPPCPFRPVYGFLWWLFTIPGGWP